MVRIHPQFEDAHAGLPVGRFEGGTLSELGEKDTLLLSILALAVGVAGFPRLVRLKKTSSGKNLQ